MDTAENLKKDDNQDITPLLLLRRKLIYSFLMVMVAFVVLLALTLGWFLNVITPQLSEFDFYFPGTSLDVYYSFVDNDEDYVPETGDITFRYFYPGCQVFYKVIFTSEMDNARASGYFFELTEPADQWPGAAGGEPRVNTLDLIDALYIQFDYPDGNGSYTGPLRGLMMAGTRDLEIFADNLIEKEGEFVFKFRIFMPSHINNDYQNLTMSISKANFSIYK